MIYSSEENENLLNTVNQIDLVNEYHKRPCGDDQRSFTNERNDNIIVTENR